MPSTPSPIGRSRMLRRPAAPPRAVDIVLGVLSFGAVGVVFVGRMFAYGMDVWAAGGSPDVADQVSLAQMAFTWKVLIVSLLLAGVAALLRARWTAALQLVAVVLLFGLTVLLRHDFDRSHPAPPAPLNSGYTPCYSGSGRCN
ncbi:DUF6234 family protein [Kitasatospora cinereorecta]|uniref:DUF6234 family protein n=1 Tax=Kitasatospora cinereorecta TaxID=285560 RepID=A0ABW0VNI0_9ACTN